VFVVAGFAASAQSWAVFASEWRAALAEPPHVDYFKMTEAARLRRQFDRKRGWDEARRDARLSRLCGIVARHAHCKIQVSIDSADFERFLKAIPLPERRAAPDSPYPLLLLQSVLAIGEPCDFVFDVQGFSAETFAWWPTFREIAGPAIGGPPAYADDKRYPALQAADLYAWQARRQKIDGAPCAAELDALPTIAAHLAGPDVLRLCALLREIGERIPLGTRFLRRTGAKRRVWGRWRAGTLSP
jgi:hypothetical protein